MKFKQFAHWFRNSFWYHYKWHTLGALFGVILITMMIVELANREHPDFTYVMALESVALSEQLNELDSLAEGVLKDTNGDGEVLVRGTMLGFDDRTQMGMAARIKFTAELSDSNMLLFILDEPTATQRQELIGAFLPLSELGLPSEPAYPHMLRVDDSPVFRRMGLQDNIRLYACIKALPTDERAKDDVRAAYEQAVEMVRLLINKDI